MLGLNAGVRKSWYICSLRVGGAIGLVQGRPLEQPDIELPLLALTKDQGFVNVKLLRWGIAL